MLKTEAINLLLVNFKAEVTDGLMQGYSIGVREYSENTVEQAVINFFQDKVSAHNSAFCPTPAELAKECDRIVNVDRIRKELEIAARKRAYEKSNLVRLPKNHFMNKYKPGSKFKG